MSLMVLRQPDIVTRKQADRMSDTRHSLSMHAQGASFRRCRLLPFDHDKLKEALIKSESIFILARGAWRQRKAWGGAKRNPRTGGVSRQSPRSGRQRIRHQ